MIFIYFIAGILSGIAIAFLFILRLHTKVMNDAAKKNQDYMAELLAEHKEANRLRHCQIIETRDNTMAIRGES